jgi:hypothetical protein
VLSAIGISPLDDNVRIVGTTDGQVWMTQSGSSTLTNVTSGSFPFSSTGTRYVSRALIDPNDTNTAWVCFGGFGMPAGQHIWKTNNLAGGAGTWVASGNGIPDVPVDAFAIDAAKPLEMYAGTDIGVYKTTDGGANWFPFNTGMPVVAVFDMAIQQTNRTMRIATHGRGMWERLLDAGPAAVASLVRSEVIGGHVLLSWHTDQQPGATTRLYRRYVPGNWQQMTTLTVDGEGGVSYDDGTAHANAVYDYRLGLLEGGAETFAGAIRVDVAAANRLTLVGANPTISGMRVAFMLPEPSPARIDVVDVTGRRVYTREVGSMGAGRHEIDLRQERFTPGIYWVRLVQGERMSSAKIAVLGSGE